MAEIIDYTPEVNHFVENGFLTPSDTMIIPYPGPQQGDSTLVREFSDDLTTRVYHLNKRYIAGHRESQTYLTATIDTKDHHLNTLVPFAWRNGEGNPKLRFGLLLKGSHPNGGVIYQPDMKYDVGTILYLDDQSKTMQFWYPVKPLPLSELTGVRLAQALFKSASPMWNGFLVEHTINTDPDQHLSIEAQVAILNASAK